MSDQYIQKIAYDMSLDEKSVLAAVQLLDGGATLPFIARYRKEATGGMDEVAIAGIRDRLLRLRQLDERRQAILRSLAGRRLLTPQLQESISGAESLARLEDIYLPFRPKKKDAGLCRQGARPRASGQEDIRRAGGEGP